MAARDKAGSVAYYTGMRIQRSLLGASVSRDKAFFTRHRGTCADPACATVVDTMPETGARLVTFPTFAVNQPVQIDSVGQNYVDQHLRAARALSQVGRLTYSQAHCDQLATDAETGEFYSPQALKFIFWAGVAGLIFVTLRSAAK